MFVREAFETRLGRGERDRTWFLPTKTNSSRGLIWRLELLTAVKCCLNLKNAIDYNFFNYSNENGHPEICSTPRIGAFNPLNPRTDQHVISPYYIHTSSSKQVIRILKLITHKLLSWSNTKFSQIFYKGMCSSYREELTIKSWELKG